MLRLPKLQVKVSILVIACFMLGCSVFVIANPREVVPQAAGLAPLEPAAAMKPGLVESPLIPAPSPALPLWEQFQMTPANALLAENTLGRPQPETITEIVPRPMGRQMGGPGRLIGQRTEVVEGPVRSSLLPPPPSEEGGYFPTQLESQILGGDYPRERGDGSYWGYSGIWPVRSAPDNFYQRNGAFYDRVERGLSTFVPGRSPLFHSDYPNLWTVGIDYSIGGILSRGEVAPERVQLKLGPLMIDVLGISGSVLYTSYSGDVPLVGVPSSGWISIISVPVRASLRLTDTLYVTASAFLYYLPGSNSFGAGSGIGTGLGLATNARLNYEFQGGDPWHFRLYDYFGYLPPTGLGDIYENWEVGEIDAVGRYRFGSTGGFNTNSNKGLYWNPQFGGYRNDLGFEAQRPFDNKWWFLSNLVHSDYWGESDFGDYNHADQVSLLYAYMGTDWMFAPSFGYTMTSTDYFDTMSNQVYARFTGRLTEYLTSFAQVGYFWQTGDNASISGALTWELGLTHDLTTYTKQSLSGGQVYNLSDRLEEFMSEYVRYTLTHAFSQRLSVGIYGQYSDSRRLRDSVQSSGWDIGSTAHYVLGQDTSITAGARYGTGSNRNSSGPDNEYWFYFATVTRPLLSRLDANMTYQYGVERGGPGANYTEHLLMFSLNFRF